MTVLYLAKSMWADQVHLLKVPRRKRWESTKLVYWQRVSGKLCALYLPVGVSELCIACVEVDAGLLEVLKICGTHGWTWRD